MGKIKNKEGMNEVSFFIPFNTPSSKNGRVWTGSHLVSSKSTQKWRKLTKKTWDGYKDAFLFAIKDIQKPYNIEFTFIRGTRHKFDYINPLQTVLDEMVKRKWIDDDNADEIKPSFGDYQYSKTNPGVIIKILKNKT